MKTIIYELVIAQLGIFKNVVKCLSFCGLCKCFKSRADGKTREEDKQNNRFANGFVRFNNEMNIVGILKQLRVSKMLFRTSMTGEERLLTNI